MFFEPIEPRGLNEVASLLVAVKILSLLRPSLSISMTHLLVSDGRAQHVATFNRLHRSFNVIFPNSERNCARIICFAFHILT